MLISVLVPVYNEGVINLTKAITSIISQTYIGKIEIIVVDDGSDANHNTEWLERQFGKNPISHIEFKRYFKTLTKTLSNISQIQTHSNTYFLNIQRAFRPSVI